MREFIGTTLLYFSVLVFSASAQVHFDASVEVRFDEDRQVNSVFLRVTKTEQVGDVTDEKVSETELFGAARSQVIARGNPQKIYYHPAANAEILLNNPSEKLTNSSCYIGTRNTGRLEIVTPAMLFLFYGGYGETQLLLSYMPKFNDLVFYGGDHDKRQENRDLTILSICPPGLGQVSYPAEDRFSFITVWPAWLRRMSYEEIIENLFDAREIRVIGEYMR